MSISEIALSWFRGAADRIALTTNNKSIVVCGPNGAGKTSLVDGIEYEITGGKIAHLAHEHSGRRQELGVINTHAAENAERKVELTLDNGEQVVATIAANGAPTFQGREFLAGWDCGRVILRQDEVANFIHAKKGEKYSALLPLIGLDPLENVAVNLHALIRKVRDESGVERKRGSLELLQQQWAVAFPEMNAAAVGEAMKVLHAKYLPEADAPPESLDQAVDDLRPILAARIQGLNAEHAVHMHLKTAHDAALATHMDGLTAASEQAAGFAEPLLEERLGILRSANGFGAKLEGEEQIPCPACGQNIGPDEFRGHVAAETKRLEEALRAYETRRQALGRLANAIATVTGALNRAEMANWRGHVDQDSIRQHLETLFAIDVEQLRSSAPAELIVSLKAAIPLVVARLAECAAHIPPSVDELVQDQKTVEAAASHPKMRTLRKEIAAIDDLLAFLAEAEGQTRSEIKDRTEHVIADISDDMQRMWGILHPGEPIDTVRLYQADGADKAIDIALRFHGVDQLSPRLTLSEGHRNSLGLCVFLALAKHGDEGLPLILDDVVTSLDREHRANVATLLMDEFSGTQVLLFTHEVDWYIELKYRLPGPDWSFKILAPWAGPETGIRWDRTPQGFDEARAHLDTNPSIAAARARAIMDIHMAVIAERLRIPVPYIRGPKNDLRNALDLLNRFIGLRNKFKINGETGIHEPWAALIEKAEAARDLLVPFANPGVHGRAVARNEALLLIDASESFLEGLKCPTCGTYVWALADNPRRRLRCDCGMLRWDL